MGNEIVKSEDANMQAMALGTTRQAQEVQAAMVVAKKFPRDEFAAIARIKQSCKRVGLASSAMYAYPRGGQTVTGPSIRLAETVAQNYGNIDFGIIELSQEKGESQVMSYAWDLESNTRVTKIFSIKHERHTKKGVKKLSDPRDIYELVANQGSRRLRACIMGVIPGDIIDVAVSECEQTLKGDQTGPIEDRIRKMLEVFKEIGVTQKMIEDRLKHNIDATIDIELIGLAKIYKSIKDGMARVEDFFEDKSSPTAKFGDDKAPEKKPEPKKEETVPPVGGNRGSMSAPVPEVKPEPKKEEPVKEKTPEPKAEKKEEVKEEPKTEDPDWDNITTTLPETQNMPQLEKLLKDNGLYPEQMVNWAEKNSHDLKDNDFVLKAINGFGNIQDAIGKF